MCIYVPEFICKHVCKRVCMHIKWIFMFHTNCCEKISERTGDLSKATEPVSMLETILEASIQPQNPLYPNTLTSPLVTKCQGVNSFYATKPWQHTKFLKPHLVLSVPVNNTKLKHNHPWGQVCLLYDLRQLRSLSGVSLLSQVEIYKNKHSFIVT